MPHKKHNVNLSRFVTLKSLLIMLLFDVELTISFDNNGCNYNPRTHTLDCKNLVQIPTENDCKTATHMYISSSNIPVLQNDILTEFTEIREIDIQNSNVHTVEPYAFRGLVFLEYLYLTHNHIHTLSSVVLPDTLQYLDISNNPLDSSHESPFPKIESNIATLYSSEVGLKEIDKSHVMGLKSLRRWRIMRNKLNVLNLDALVNLVQISSVDVEFNNIDRIIPPTGGKTLEHLTFLDVGYNSLKFLDENIFQGLPDLQELRLHGNPLIIPENAPLLSHKAISRIILSRIDARALSRNTFQNLPQLSKIELIDSGITDISGVFSGLQKLQFLNLRNNSVEFIKRGTFSASGSLQQLILEHNPLGEFEIEAIEGVMTRGAIDISYTPFACFSRHIVLESWCEEHGVDLHVTCSVINTCYDNEDCNKDEHCCKNNKCSENGECSGASISTPVSFTVIILLASIFTIYKGKI